MSYRTHQLRLLPRLAATYALHAAQQRLVADAHKSLTEGSTDQRRLEPEAAGLKALTSRHATDTIQEGRECAAEPATWANRFAELKADTDIFTTFEGDNTVLLQLVAKALPRRVPGQTFGDLDPRARAASSPARSGGTVL